VLVDDDDLNRSLIGSQLKRNGATLVEAANAEMAIAMAAEPALDLILMDIQMPDIDGITAIKEIRRLSHCAHLAIAGFTAYIDECTKERILAAGADDIIPKLLDEVDFIREVYRVLKHVGSPS
jgi:two-component system sensor histidine kinase BarA